MDNHQNQIMKNQETIRGKRKISNDHFQVTPRYAQLEEEHNEMLNLTLGSPLACPPTRPRPLPPMQQSLTPPMPMSIPPPPPPPPMQRPQSMQALLSQPTLPQLPLQRAPYVPAPPFVPHPPPPVQTPAVPVRSQQRPRKNPTQAPKEGKGDLVPVPFAWATNRRATVHSLTYLESHQIFTISGEVQCRRCERHYEIEYDLRQKFLEIGTYIAKHKSKMHDRAPSNWMNPTLPSCKFCDQENSVRPVIADKKKSINWLFLLLGQMLGCCTLEQLKYFCKHTKNHRTGAKDRVLYLTYLALCKQLDPSGPFDR